MSRHQACAQSRLQVVVTGVIFLVCGVALLARLRGWWQLENEWAWWPLGLVIPGILRLAAPAPQRSVLAAFAWFAVAAALILANLGHLELRARDLVPLALVAFGVRLLYRARTETKGVR
jgi:hypothetical protein